MFHLCLSPCLLATPVQNDHVVSPSSFVAQSYILINVEARFTSERNKGYENTTFQGNYAVGSLEPLTLTGTPVWFRSKERRDGGLDALGCTGTVDNFHAPAYPWIAAVMKGDCSFTEKARNAKILNATGLLVLHRYDDYFIMAVNG